MHLKKKNSGKPAKKKALDSCLNASRWVYLSVFFFFFLMRHIRRHKLTRKLGTVESSIKANDNVTVVTFLNPILQSTFQAQHQLNDVRVLHDGDGWKTFTHLIPEKEVKMSISNPGIVFTFLLNELEPINTWVISPRYECQLYPFPMKTKTRF